MATDREREREAELESAMYTNCLLLGLDPAILGGAARVGLFRRSNPGLGEQLIFFLLSALRGPVQSAKDFDKVWPIVDPPQPHKFRKVARDVMVELESLGVLPRINSTTSSLATCCGPRFVELLWQLSVHALPEVHKRTFATDVASNPLPASLTDISYLHAAALLPVTKARIALERRKFLKNANTAVRKQTTWSNLANEMTAEFRGLCAEEAYLQQELEKLQEMRNKAKLEGDLWDERISSSSVQNSHLVTKATRLWESLLARKSQHEVLASGPIEDLIAHREHRYRISGSSLLAAMDLSSHSPSSDELSGCVGEKIPPVDNQDQVVFPKFHRNSETFSRPDDRNGRVLPTVDIAEILRRWTHALQRIHKQSLHLAKANDGEGPELLRFASDSGTNGHAESLGATLAEHRQHLANIQGLINQLKEAVPAMQKSIAELTEEVNSISPVVTDEYSARITSTIQAQTSGRHENSSGDVADMTSNLSSDHLDIVSSSPALKLPHLFSTTPNPSGKGTQTPKRHVIASQPIHRESFPTGKLADPPFAADHSDRAAQDGDSYFARNLRRSVREAALSRPSVISDSSEEKGCDNGSEHFFMPPSTKPQEGVDTVPNRRKQPHSIRNSVNAPNQPDEPRDKVDGLKTTTKMDFASFVSRKTSSDFDESLDKVFSPPLLIDSTFCIDTYEDLLAPLSETDAALIEC